MRIKFDVEFSLEKFMRLNIGADGTVVLKCIFEG
jgi:hypothetical protein